MPGLESFVGHLGRAPMVMAFQIRRHGGSAFQSDWYGSQFRSDALVLQLLGVPDVDKFKSVVAKLFSESEILARYLKFRRSFNLNRSLHQRSNHKGRHL